MNKVKNQKLIRLLAFREWKASRRMNVVLILSVILTCILFTCVASIGGNTVLAFQEQSMRMVGGDHMAGFKYVLPPLYDKVVADPKTKDVVYRIIVGSGINEEFRNIRTELNCAGSDDAAKACFALPTTGRLPEGIDEIAVSTLILEELHLPSELGTLVPLKIDVDGTVIMREFTLCGFWEGDGLSSVQLGWVSREFTDKYVPTPSVSFHDQKEGLRYGGYWQVDLNFGNSFDIEGKLDALLKRLDLDGNDSYETGVNWAYSMSSMKSDHESLLSFAMIALLVFFAGYLIIYNIFQLNITANIQKYGLLKTIGVTPTQIQKLVRIQAGIYAAVGIPIGLLIGLLLGNTLFQYIRPILSLHGKSFRGFGLKEILLICLIAGLFSFATVSFSVNKPAKIAGRVSPIEALRFNETKITSKKARKIRKVSPFSVAISNMARSRKKMVIVILSLTLCLVLFNTIAIVFHGLDMDKMLQHLMVGDFEVLSDKSSTSPKKSKILPERIEAVRAMDGVKDCSAVYYVDAEVILSGKSLERAEELFESYGEAEKWEEVVENDDFKYSEGLDRYLTLRNLARGAEPYIEPGHVKSDLYAVGGGLLDYLNVVEGTIDAQKFQTGNYAVIYTKWIPLDSEDKADDFFGIGDKVTVRVDDREKEYEVMAIADIPYSLSTKSYHQLYAHVLLPESEYSYFSENENAMNLMIRAKDGEYDRVRDALKDMASTISDGFLLMTKQDYLDEYKGLQQMYKVVGGALTIILGMIGILNYVNAVVTGMISRKKEFVVMQAVGMTGKQMKEMLIWEGATYVFWTFLCSAGIGSVLASSVLKNLARQSAFFSYHFTIAPILTCIPILLVLAIVVPLLSFRWISRGNTVNVVGLE